MSQHYAKTGDNPVSDNLSKSLATVASTQHCVLALFENSQFSKRHYLQCEFLMQKE
jgi:hypothetical protein